jgi:hypothetical protein
MSFFLNGGDFMALNSYTNPDCVEISGELRLNLSKPLSIVINGVEVMVIDAEGNLSVRGNITSGQQMVEAQPQPQSQPSTKGRG